MSLLSRMPCFSICASLKALTATGTSCMRSARLRAVTVTLPRVLARAAGSGNGDA
jgi:hypothetical protein